MDRLSEIKKAIADFIAAGDNNDTELLAKVLHPNYQNIQNGFFDQPGLRIIDREEYIELVRTRRFGGNPRTIAFEFIEEMENIAIARVKLESEHLKFLSYITVAYEEDTWQVINNTPKVELKNRAS